VPTARRQAAEIIRLTSERVRPPAEELAKAPTGIDRGADPDRYRQQGEPEFGDGAASCRNAACLMVLVARRSTGHQRLVW
jgi:hypothetical protein